MQLTQIKDDTALVCAAQTDAQAFGALYDRYVQRVYRYCYYRTNSVPDAEDLTAQIFLAVLEGLPGYKQNGYFAGWLFSIARKKVADFYRRTPHLSLEEVTFPPIQTDLEMEVETSQRRERLRSMIQSLEKEEQELIHLRYVAELSFAEIAKVLQKKEEAVKKNLYRLIARLKNGLETDHE